MTIKKVGLVAALTATSGLAMAEAVPINVTDAVAQIATGQTAIAAVGAAILILAAISLGFRWVKAQFF